MKKIILLSLVITLILSVTVFAHPFSDISGHWGEEEIELAYNNKIINGDSDGYFRPEDNVSRAEFVKMLAVVDANDLREEIPETENDSHWVMKYYEYAKNSFLNQDNENLVNNVYPGIIEENTADLPIERWEMAYMVWSKIEKYIVPSQEMENPFNDEDLISQKFSKDIENPIIYCALLGVTLGDENKNYNAENKATRAESVTIINRLSLLLEDIKLQLGIQPDYSKDEFTTEIDESIEHKMVEVTMENGGKFIIELYPEFAPETVENFINLVNGGFYDGVSFHRIVEGFVAQGGDPTGTGAGGSGINIIGEFKANGFEKNNLSHTRGIVSMARAADFNSASSQFFICYDDVSFLNGNYAAFGKVIEGMEVVDDFIKVEMEDNGLEEQSKPKEPIIIKTMKLID